MGKAMVLKKASGYFLGAVLLLGIAGLGWYYHQTLGALGAHTPVVDPTEFVEEFSTLGITNVNVLHPDGESFIPNQTVVLRDGKLFYIGIELPDSTLPTINGEGKYLIPGLTDTHVHLKLSKNDLMLYLANGVTGIWENFGYDEHLEWKEEIEQGAVGPDIYLSTRKLGAGSGWYNWGKKYFYAGHSFSDTVKVRTAIREFKHKGYDALKLGSFLDSATFDVILDEAHQQEMKVIGHLPHDVGYDHVISSGIAQLSHIEELTKALADDFGGLGYENTDEFLVYVASRADSVAIQLKEQNIAVSTTLYLMESLPKQKFELESYINEVEFAYANPALVEGRLGRRGWLPGNNSYENLEIKNDPKQRPNSELFWNTYVEAIHIMAKALSKHEVMILAGTDANTPVAVPGFSLHQELVALQQLGLSPAEILRSATQHPASFTGWNSGFVEVGKAADLILLDKNPLEDITHSQSIYTVIKGRRYLTATHRQQMLEAIKTANAEVRTVEISIWLEG